MSSEDPVYLVLQGDDDDPFYEPITPQSSVSSSTSSLHTGIGTSASVRRRINHNGSLIGVAGELKANDCQGTSNPRCSRMDSYPFSQTKHNEDLFQRTASLGTTQDSTKRKLEIKFKNLKKQISKMKESESGREAGRTLVRVTESISERFSGPVSR
jgi:hypothetical protein